MAGLTKIALKVALWVAAIGLIVFGVLRVFFMDIVVMGHDGMAPTLLAGEEVLMWRGADDAETGDILVCHHPTDNGQMVMGRVIGKSGMNIHADRGQLSVSGTRPQRNILNEEIRFFDNDLNRNVNLVLSEDTFGNTTHMAFWPEGQFRLRDSVVGANHYYLLGDNRSQHANDSRTFGHVAMSRCIGRLFMRLKPVDNDRGATVDRGWFDLLD